MKNEVNRAFMAKKKNYINPEVLVAPFASMTLMQAGSPAPVDGSNKVNDKPTNVMW